MANRLMIGRMDPLPITFLGTGTAGKLVMNHRRGSWIAINNTSLGQPFRSGLLFQLGGASGVRLRKEEQPLGDQIVAHSPGTMFWINIVSAQMPKKATKRDDEENSPIRPRNVLALSGTYYPSFFDNPIFQFMPSIQLSALPTRKLHRLLNPISGIITYWQGGNGFTLEAKGPTQGLDNDFTFGLRDPFKVEIYTIYQDGTVILDHSHPYGDVDHFEVGRAGRLIETDDGRWLAHDPEEGNKQDPPWTPPPNPPTG